MGNSLPSEKTLVDRSITVPPSRDLAAIIDVSFPMFLMAAQGRGPLSDLPLDAFDQYAHDVVADICGDWIVDRMLKFLVQQFIIGHYTVMRLHAEGAGCTDPELRRANHCTGTKLGAEMRRLSREIDERKSMLKAALEKRSSQNELIGKRIAS